MANRSRIIRCDYTMVAEARGQTVLWYRQFGDYQGEWLLLSTSATSHSAGSSYWIYKGYYGSCSGCDDLQATFSNGEIDADAPAVQEFIASYPPFAEMEHSAALRIARRDRNLTAVIPANSRFEGEGPDPIGRQLALIILSRGYEIRAEEIIEIDNLEGRREAIERYGATRWVEEIGAELIDRETPNFLYRLEREGQEPYCFLHLKDGSTDRRYVLRVGPEHRTVRAARAASFGIPSEKFDLALET